MRLTTVAQGVKSLAKFINPSYVKYVTCDLGMATWIEGGEWPGYDDRFSTFALKSPANQTMSETLSSCGTLDNLLQIVAAHDFDSRPQCTVVAPNCVTTGKVCVVVSSKLRFERKFIVSLSTRVAMDIARNDGTEDVVFVESLSTSITEPGTYSVGVGLMLHILLRRQLRSTDVLMLNSPNSQVLSSSIVTTIQRHVNWHVITVLPNQDPLVERLIRERQMHRDKQLMLSSSIVGPVDSTVANLLPNEYIGRYKPSKHVSYDSSQRIDPLISCNGLEYYVRTATHEDMLGLRHVACTDDDGTYTRLLRTAVTELSQCKLYYDVLHLVILIAIGLHDGDKRTATQLWKRNALISEHMSLKLPLSVAPYRITDSSRVVVGYDHLAMCDWTYYSQYYQYGTTLRDATRKTLLSAIDMQVQSINNKYTVFVTVSQIWTEDNLAYVSLLEFNALHVSCEGSRIVHRDVDMSKLRLSNISLLNVIWYALSKMLQNSDVIYIVSLPFCDTRQVDVLSREDARQVLSKTAIASYSERELHSVLSLWNDYASRHVKRPISNYKRISLFLDYFIERGLHFDL